mgnify:CR=1 FL=1|jgi:hypothetical protein
MAGLAFDKRGDFRRNGNANTNHDYLFNNNSSMGINLSYNAFPAQEESEFGDEV